MNEKIRSLGKKCFRAIFILCKHKRCIMHKWKRRTKTYQEKLEILSNESRFLCMHKILVHAQHSCACTTLLCMHKSVVHAQECCACTRILCMHKNLDSFDRISNFSWYVLVRLFHLCIIHLLCLHNINIALKHFFPRDLIFSFIYTYIVD